VKLAALLALVPCLALAQPQIGQPGKDVIWLPAELVMVERMLDIAQLTPGDTLIDLGSGDGRTVIQAARRGARGIGVEYDAALVEHARELARKAGVADRATFEHGDLYAADLTRASVITLFLLPSINIKLRPKLLELRPGTRIVSNTFTMDQWESDGITQADAASGCSLYCVARLWIVPARVEGRWRLAGADVEFRQRFQTVSGTIDGVALAGRLRGDEIVFNVGGAEYRGRVAADAIEGTLPGGGPWRAVRVP
jgi:hypothetical protein